MLKQTKIMEAIQQIRRDISSLLEVGSFKFESIDYNERKNRLSVSISVKINGRTRVLRQSEKSIIGVASALQNEYDTIVQAKYETETFKL